MKHLLIALFCCFTLQAEKTFLGNQTSRVTWAYLSGLVEDPYSEEDQYKTLDQIGNDLSIRIIAFSPPVRSPLYQNRLCWPHENQEAVLSTYATLKQQLSEERISGLIGFSNGGFFLLKLAEQKELDIPLVVIGAGIYPSHTNIRNRVILLISKEDTAHYSLAKMFCEREEGSLLNLSCHEYPGGHIIPQVLVKKVVSLCQSENCLSCTFCKDAPNKDQTFSQEY